MKSKLILRKLLPLVLHPFRYFALAIALSMTFCLATPDCMARSIQNGAFESFHQQAWREDREGRRLSEWKKFLNQYELIGMSKADLESLLGPAHFNSGSQPKVLDMLPLPSVAPGKVATYPLYSTTSCGRGSHSINILLNDQDRVSAWRLNGVSVKNLWFKRNVVFPAGKDFQFDKENFGLIDKGDLDAIDTSKDNFLVDYYKKDPSAILERHFYPKSFLCGAGFNSQFHGIGDVSGKPYDHSFLLLGNSSVADPGLKVWREGVEQKINSVFRQSKSHSEVGDRLLAVDAEFSIDDSGRIRDLYVDLHCPADFLQMIVETLKSCQGSEEITLPGDRQEAVKINSKFIQNFGPKFIDKSIN